MRILFRLNFSLHHLCIAYFKAFRHISHTESTQLFFTQRKTEHFSVLPLSQHNFNTLHEKYYKIWLFLLRIFTTYYKSAFPSAALKQRSLRGRRMDLRQRQSWNYVIDTRRGSCKQARKRTRWPNQKLCAWCVCVCEPGYGAHSHQRTHRYASM